MHTVPCGYGVQLDRLEPDVDGTPRLVQPSRLRCGDKLPRWQLLSTPGAGTDRVPLWHFFGYEPGQLHGLPCWLLMFVTGEGARDLRRRVLFAWRQRSLLRMYPRLPMPDRVNQPVASGL